MVLDAYQTQKNSSITITRNISNITHQEYVDDTILSGKSIVFVALGLKVIIKSYMDASDQKVNDGKLEIYFLNTNSKMENMICRIMGFNKGQFSM